MDSQTDHLRGGTCGFVHVQTFNSNLKELGVVESKRNAIRRGFVHELLNAQDTVLCSYFAQRAGTKNDGCGQKSNVEALKSSKDWRDLNENWWKAVGRTWTGRQCVESTSERVDVRRLKQDEKARVWQAESSMEGSRWCTALLAAPKN